MIVLTKLDGTKVLVSPSSIKYFESVPDTIVFFLNADSIIVKEKFDEIINAVQQFESAIYHDTRME